MSDDLISRSAVCAKCGAKEAGELFSCSDECLIFPGNVPSVDLLCTVEGKVLFREAYMQGRFDGAMEAKHATDTVAVVRCKKCKHYEPYEKPVEDFDGRCLMRACETDEEEFCSYGEKKDA